MPLYKLQMSLIDTDFPHAIMQQLCVAGWIDPVDMRVRFESSPVNGPLYTIHFELQRQCSADGSSDLEHNVAQMFAAFDGMEYVSIDLELHMKPDLSTDSDERSAGPVEWTLRTDLSKQNHIRFFCYHVPKSRKGPDSRIEVVRKLLQLYAIRSFEVTHFAEYDEVRIFCAEEFADGLSEIVGNVLGRFAASPA